MGKKNIILLTGFMAAGKTTAGRTAADILGLPFIDLDQKIEEVAGASISSLFAAQGEACFRKLESR
ncbi:MAG TPA: shikimate kinase, partial [Candidatus Rifleibacterium sp.]|nr:shikimate kinase [Candidatus Rifleibacterium sp.]